jgi:hypothetical protein
MSVYETGGALSSTGAFADCHECRGSELESLERTRFFPRQIVGADDLTADQRYLREKHRRHNRLLHGWGIVCGVRVRGLSGCRVSVEPGYVLGPHGDEIVIGDRVEVDVCREDLDGFAVCGDADRWCTDVRADRTPDAPLYLAVRYCERPTRPVRVMSCGCGCDDTECEYSRTRDGYVIKVLTELPDGYTTPMVPPGAQGLIEAASCVLGRRKGCLPCPESPWVILADLAVDDEEVTVDCDPHRRYAVSFGAYWFTCEGQEKYNLGALQGMVGKTVGAQQGSSLIVENAPADRPPPATVAVRLDDRWASVPATFTLQPDETVGTLLAREGDTQYRDPATGDSYTLSELYASAAVDPDTPVRSHAEALAPLEGRRLDIGGLRVVRGALDELLDRGATDALDKDHAGAPSAAGELRAADLGGRTSKGVAEALADETIAEVAREPRESFVKRMSAGAAKSRTGAIEREAAELHATARRVVGLADAWKEGRGAGGPQR